MSNPIHELAADFLTETQKKGIDHGLDEPRRGGHAIVRDLQEDLVREQKAIHKQASEDAAQRLQDRLFETSDLYAALCADDGVVITEQSDIIFTHEGVENWNGAPYEEVFYSCTVVYKVDLDTHLMSMGIPEDLRLKVARNLQGKQGLFNEYIEQNGAQELLDRWLPGNPGDPQYELKWEMVSVYYREVGWVDITLEVSERALRPLAEEGKAANA